MTRAAGGRAPLHGRETKQPNRYGSESAAGVEHLTPLVLREPDVLGDPVRDVAGLDRLPVPEDLKDGK